MVVWSPQAGSPFLIHASSISQLSWLHQEIRASSHAKEDYNPLVEPAVQGSPGTSLFHFRLENSGPTQQFCFAQYFAGRGLKCCSSSEGRGVQPTPSPSNCHATREKLSHCKARWKKQWEAGGTGRTSGTEGKTGCSRQAGTWCEITIADTTIAQAAFFCSYFASYIFKTSVLLPSSLCQNIHRWGRFSLYIWKVEPSTKETILQHCTNS